MTSLLLLVVCVPLDTRQANTVPADTVIALERTACYGACPAYSVSIDATGNVTYNGSQHVRVTGGQVASIPVARVAALLATARRIGFFTLRDRYFTDDTGVSATDMPTAYVTISTEGRTKRITDYFGAPAALRALERQIDDAAQTVRWVRIDEDTLQQLVREGRRPTPDQLRQLMGNALRFDEVGVVKAPIELGVDPSKPLRDEGGSLLLFVRSAAAARVLLDAGADPRGPPLLGAMPLGIAAHLAPEVTEMLLAAGAPADDGLDFTGRRPLIAAACAGNAGVVRLLLNAGASPAHRTTTGLSALDCARIGKRNREHDPVPLAPPFRIDYEDVIALLEQAGLKPRHYR